jgi:hypothetical protein
MEIDYIDDKYNELMSKIKGGTIYGEPSDKDIKHIIVSVYNLAKQEASEQYGKIMELL